MNRTTTTMMSLNDSFDDSSVGFNSLAIIDSYIKESTQMMSFDEAMRDMPAEGIDEYLNTRDGYISDRVGSDNNSIGNQSILYNSKEELLSSLESQISSWNLQTLTSSSHHSLLSKTLEKRIKSVLPALRTKISKQLNISRSNIDNSSSKSSILSTKKIDPIACDVRYTSLSQWSSDTVDAQVKAAYVHVIEQIMQREASILKLQKVCALLDSSYWKYSYERLKVFTKNKNLKSGLLVSYLELIQKHQEELSVAIAHYRSSCIGVIDSIVEWRNACQRDKKRNDTVSVYWEGENYLFRMLDDTKVFNDYYCIRLWLGFAPNTFFLPPSSSNTGGGGSDRDIWAQRYSMYQTWLKQNTQYVMQEKRKARNMGSMDLGTPPLTSSSVDIVSEIGSVLASQQSISSTSLRTPATGDSNMQWKKLSEYCWQSYGRTMSIDGQYYYDDSLMNEFWSNMTHNPLVVEVAVGYSDAFPIVPLVPSLQTTTNSVLLSKLQYSQYIIDKEIKLYDNLLQLAEQTRSLRAELNQTVTSEALENIIAGSKYYESWESYSKLVQRQLSYDGKVDGSISNYLSEKQQRDITSNKIFAMTDVPVLDTATTTHSPSLAVDASKLLKKIKERLDKETHLVENSNGYLRIKSDVIVQRLGLRPINETSSLFKLKCVVKIQKQVRGMLTRNRLRVKAQSRLRLRALLTMQTWFRSVIARRRVKLQRKLFRVESMILRKYYINKNQGSFVITKFLRNSIEKKRVKKEEMRLLRQRSVKLMSHKLDMEQQQRMRDHKSFVSEKDQHKIEEYRQRMLLNHDVSREEKIVGEMEGLAQSKPSILAGDDDGDYTVLHSTTHSLASHGNIAVGEMLESDTDVVDSTLKEDTTVKEDEINEAIDTEASDDVESLLNDIDVEVPLEKVTAKKSVKKSLNENPHFILACHILPRSERINPSSKKNYKQFAVLKERTFLSQSSCLLGCSKPQATLSSPHLAYIPPPHETKKIKKKDDVMAVSRSLNDLQVTNDNNMNKLLKTVLNME